MSIGEGFSTYTRYGWFVYSESTQFAWKKTNTCSVLSFTKLVHYKVYSVKRVFPSVKSCSTVLNQGLHHRFVHNAPVANYEWCRNFRRDIWLNRSWISIIEFWCDRACSSGFPRSMRNFKWHRSTDKRCIWPIRSNSIVEFSSGRTDLSKFTVTCNRCTRNITLCRLRIAASYGK